MANENILKLTATDSGGREPSEPREQWPTYENMIRAFFTADHPPKRDMNPAAYPSQEWITEQVQVHVYQE